MVDFQLPCLITCQRVNQRSYIYIYIYKSQAVTSPLPSLLIARQCFLSRATRFELLPFARPLCDLKCQSGSNKKKILPRMFKHKGKLSSSSCEALGWPGYRKGVLENNLRAVNRPHALKDLGKGKPTQISSCYLTTAQLADRTAVFSQPCYKI